MGAQGVAFFFAEAGLEEGAEEDGLDVATVVLVGGGKQGAEFGRGQLDGVYIGKEAAVEVIHPCLRPARAGLESFIWRKRPPMRS